jgi:hypothetical protein
MPLFRIDYNIVMIAPDFQPIRWKIITINIRNFLTKVEYVNIALFRENVYSAIREMLREYLYGGYQ